MKPNVIPNKTDIKKLKEHQRQELKNFKMGKYDVEFSTPITGGNAYQTDQILKMRTQINQATNFQATMYKFENDVRDRTYNIYWLMEFQSWYFVNRFPIISQSAEINLKIYHLKKLAFFYGHAILLKINGRVAAFYIKRLTQNIWGEIETMDVIPATQVFAQQALVVDDKLKSIHLDFTKNDYDYVLFRWDGTGWGAYVWLFPFIKQQEQLLQSLGVDALLQVKKFIGQINDPNQLVSEMEQLFNPFSPALFTGLGIDEVRNIFQEFSLNSKSGDLSLLEYYDKFIETYYKLWGRRVNTSFKKERNLVGEVEAAQEEFNVLENGNFYNTKILVNELENFFGVTLEFPNGLKPAEQEIEMENADDN